MPHYFRTPNSKMKKSNQPGPGKCRKQKHCNTSGQPNKFTPGWILKDGELVHVGVDQDGNDKIEEE